AMALGAGRVRVGDRVDPAVGIMVLAKRGTRVERQHVLALVHARTEEAARAAVRSLQEAYRIGAAPPPARPLVHGRVE
ncbi:MAG: thymidine phosphorylase, partial [candidate division GAL15 bacterium]